MRAVSAFSSSSRRKHGAHTRTPSISKPVAEYAVLNLDGLGFARSSLELKLSVEI